MSHPFKRLALALICSFWPAAGSLGADFYVSNALGDPKKAWADMELRDRLAILTWDGLFLLKDGPIKSGDYAELISIHSLVPIHTLWLSSPGGSVTEALKIAEFVDKYHVEVRTDRFYECGLRPRYEWVVAKKHCGCTSSCAFIWLAAPLPKRSGSLVRVHRPYFAKGEFPDLPDAAALQQYSEATAAVRSLLERRGYSQEFIANLFRIPREQVKQLSDREIETLPFDVALDELVSARCYRGNEEKLAQLNAIHDEIARLNEKMVEINPPQDMIGYDIARHPLYAEDYAKNHELGRQIDELAKSGKPLDHFRDEFLK